MEKINKLSEEQINRLCVLTEKYKMLYEGDYIITDEGEGCNPSINERIRVAPKIKSLYEEFSKYMTYESMNIQYSYDLDTKIKWGLRTLKELWLDEVRFFYEDVFEPQPEKLSKPISSNILPSKLIDAMIAQNLVIRSENGLKWVQSASLYGYFIDLVTRKLNLRASNGRIKWKDFGFIENHASLLSTARQAVNDYTNKGLNPPEGDDIVDRLLK